MSNTKALVDTCADDVTADGMALLAILADDVVDAGEVVALRAIAADLIRYGRWLERVGIGMRLIEQIWRLGLDKAPNDRLLRHIRQVQQLPDEPAEIDLRRAV